VSLELSVVIPAFDEARRIGVSLAAIDAFLRQSGLGYESRRSAIRRRCCGI
jgi:hypothetical protein